MSSNTLSTTVLAVSGLIALAIALRALLMPGALGAGLGFGVGGADALNEIRGQYGGFFLAVGLACALAIFRVIPRQAALIVLAVTFGGILFGRLVSLGIDGGFSAYSPTIRALYVVDALGLAAALWALRGEA